MPPRSGQPPAATRTRRDREHERRERERGEAREGRPPRARDPELFRESSGDERRLAELRARIARQVIRELGLDPRGERTADAAQLELYAQLLAGSSRQYRLDRTREAPPVGAPVRERRAARRVRR